MYFSRHFQSEYKPEEEIKQSGTTKLKKKPVWLWSVSKPYRQSDRRLLAK
jgi:hypothetical protein